MSLPESKLRFLVAAACAPIIWGSTYFVISQFMPSNIPLTIAAMRVLPAGVLLLLWQRNIPRGGDVLRVALLGVLNIGFFQAMLFVSAYRLPGGLASILNATQPLMVLLLSSCMNHRPIRRLAWQSAVLGIVGILLLLWSPHAKVDASGMAAALAGAASMATGTILAKRWQIKLPVLAFTGWQLLLGGLCLLPAALWLETLPAALTTTNILAHLYLTLFGAVIAYVLFFTGVARLPAALVSSLGLLGPISAVLLGWGFLDQTLQGRQLLGFALVLLSLMGMQKAMLNSSS